MCESCTLPDFFWILFLPGYLPTTQDLLVERIYSPFMERTHPSSKGKTPKWVLSASREMKSVHVNNWLLTARTSAQRSLHQWVRPQSRPFPAVSQSFCRGHKESQKLSSLGADIHWWNNCSTYKMLLPPFLLSLYCFPQNWHPNRSAFHPIETSSRRDGFPFFFIQGQLQS